MDDERIASDDAPPATSKTAEVRESAVPDVSGSHGDSVSGHAVTINKPRAELYAFWREFNNLPAFMDNVERIDILDDRRSYWVLKAPAGKTVQWTARITDEQDADRIAWESEDGADVQNRGIVTFADAPGGRGTVVTATIAYDPPAGVVGKLVAKIFQREPAIQARRDLRRFKQLMETGEISTSSWTRAQRDEEQD